MFIDTFLTCCNGTFQIIFLHSFWIRDCCLSSCIFFRPKVAKQTAKPSPNQKCCQIQTIPKMEGYLTRVYREKTVLKADPSIWPFYFVKFSKFNWRKTELLIWFQMGQIQQRVNFKFVNCRARFVTFYRFTNIFFIWWHLVAFIFMFLSFFLPGLMICCFSTHSRQTRLHMTSDTIILMALMFRWFLM